MTTKKSTVSGAPWFEMDRMILTHIGIDGWERMEYVFIEVNKECERRNWKTSDLEIFRRILHLNKSGAISAAGKLSPWRKTGELKHAFHI